MRKLRLLLAAGLAAGALCIWRSGRVRPSRSEHAPATALPESTPPELPSQSGGPPSAALEQRLFARCWSTTSVPELAAFQRWTSRYLGASRSDRDELVESGITLARARRTRLQVLIAEDPEYALAVAVPPKLRAQLPARVQDELEAEVSGTGDFALQCATSSAFSHTGSSLQVVATVDGRNYVGHVYGRREAQRTKYGASLHGIALDGHLAIHESAARVLDRDELAARQASSAPFALEAYGRIWTAGTADELERIAGQLDAREALAGPEIPPLANINDLSPPRAADAATSFTTGTKQLLVIRVDFSDFAGDPISSGEVTNLMNNGVRPFFEAMSYGKTSLTTTVSTRVYRLPQTAASYALAENYIQLHADARTAAGADYALANFDKHIVVFRRIGSDELPGSKLDFGGRGDIVGTRVWVNGANNFNHHLLAHELGHTYGLLHANLWSVKDGNPVSSSGTTREYGDPFDAMNDDWSTDARYHFSPWAKNHLGWLPDSAVVTPKQSGTYRVYRFDSGAAPLSQPQAIRVFRDGVRSYWIGLRQNLANGAYVQWGHNNTQQTQLLDLTTPGTDAGDAPLAVGSTMTDPAYGISFRPVGRGGTEPSQYLDVEIGLPAVSPSVVASWGREFAYFYDAATGVALAPPPETNVPFDLRTVQAIAAGDQHALALKADGSVVAWGDNSNGQATLPSGLASATAVVAAGNVSGAILRDNTVRIWGEANGGITAPPAGLGGVQQLALGGSHSSGIYHALALKTDGTVVAWGSNSNGQATVPANLANVVAVAAGDRTSCALKSDGTVVRWGVLWGGAAFPTALTDVMAVAMSGSSTHTLALKRDGTVVAWGTNIDGQCNVPTTLTNVVAVAAGGFHSVALRNDGSVVSWGNDRQLQCRTPFELPRAYAIAASRQATFAAVGPTPYFTLQPASQVAAPGGNVTWSAGASGTNLTYQWRKDGVAIGGATAASYTRGNVSAADTGVYDVVTTDGTFTIPSARARLAVFVPLSINSQPVSQSLPIGSAFNVSVGVANGGGPPTYQWRLNGAAIAGATRSVYSISSISAGSAGSYDVVINDGYSSIVSATARLTIVAASRIANLSIRTNAGIGAQTLIVGFVIGGGGAATKPLLVRGVGPSLGAFGVSGVLGDPKLELYSGNLKLSENDNWNGSAQVSSVGAQVGAFALNDGSSRDAALYVPTLSSGSYSVQLSGVGGTSGVTLAEIYDATPGANFTATTPRLINVSARARSGTGAEVLIAGFAIAGETPRTVLLRAIGPTLSAFGVPDVLADPKLEVFNDRAVLIGNNDNWGGGTALATAFANVGAFSLPSSSRDAALVTSLAPGSYTVQVSGVGGTTGVALVEIYEVP